MSTHSHDTHGQLKEEGSTAASTAAMSTQGDETVIEKQDDEMVRGQKQDEENDVSLEKPVVFIPEETT